jgi:nucleoside-diphosphate-sugar epimerase
VFVEEDFSYKEAINRAIHGVSYIIHTENPTPRAYKMTEEEEASLAKSSMMEIITAAIRHRVKRLVVTSSAGTMYAGLPK